MSMPPPEPMCQLKGEWGSEGSGGVKGVGELGEPEGWGVISLRGLGEPASVFMARLWRQGAHLDSEPGSQTDVLGTDNG